MTGDFALNWATLAVSVFNTILLLWLGLTVLLNSERRSTGVWVAGMGLLMSSLFFLSHTAILGLGSLESKAGVDTWWRTGWIPVLCMPFAWYMVMLWYSSYWDEPRSEIHQRHQVPIVLASLLAISIVGLVFLFNALPTYQHAIQLNLGGVLSLGGIPVLMFAYPVYLVMCIGFSLDALLHPGEPIRLMGQLARQRARPWLIAATTSLLLVSITVGVITIWGIFSANQGINPSKFTLTISIFDLIIDLFIAMTIISVGQAIIAYEVFTGKILPRQGLRRYWELAIILSISFAMLVSWALLRDLEPVYLLLLGIVLITAIYALVSWRSFREQERYLKNLHPFITSQHLYDQLLLHNAAMYDGGITNAFYSMCSDVLGVKQATLIPLGIYGPLAGKPIIYPSSQRPAEMDELITEIRHILATDAGTAPILLPTSAAYGKNSLAISLWSERGLIGALVLDEKLNRSLFTQEEIEIARTLSERLIDSQASNQLAQKLMELERQRLSESKLVDQHTRRTLHDEILPRLQSAMINLSSNSSLNEVVVGELGEIHRQLSALLQQLPAVADAEVKRLGLIEALRITVEEEYRPYFTSCLLEIDEQAREKVSSLPPTTAEVFYHSTREAIRNAARHGRQPGSDQPLNLLVSIQWKDGMQVKIQDDGAGFDPASRYMPGAGQGLALHSTLMAVVGGSLAIESVAGKMTQVILKLPAGEA